MKRFYLITLFLSLQYATNFDLEDGYQFDKESILNGTEQFLPV